MLPFSIGKIRFGRICIFDFALIHKFIVFLCKKVEKFGFKLNLKTYQRERDRERGEREGEREEREGARGEREGERGEREREIKKIRVEYETCTSA